jgi:hypothetical protein
MRSSHLAAIAGAKIGTLLHADLRRRNIAMTCFMSPSRGQSLALPEGPE